MAKANVHRRGSCLCGRTASGGETLHRWFGWLAKGRGGMARKKWSTNTKKLTCGLLTLMRDASCPGAPGWRLAQTPRAIGCLQGVSSWRDGGRGQRAAGADRSRFWLQRTASWLLASAAGGARCGLWCITPRKRPGFAEELRGPDLRRVICISCVTLLCPALACQLSVRTCRSPP